MTRAILAAACLLLPSLLTIGCGPSETIEARERPRTEPPRPPLDVEAFRSRLDHMLAAMVPHDEHVWFVKLNAPAKHVGDVREPFLKLVGSLKFDEQRDRPAWKLPDQWRELPGDRMTAAKVSVPAGDDTLTLTLTRLPKSDQWNELLASNVNRWLRQLGHSPFQRGGNVLEVNEVVKLAQKQATVDGEATWFELTGILPKDDMPPGHPPVARGDRAAPPSPAPTERRPDAPPTSSPAAAEGFSYDAPSNWSLGPAQRNRKATFQVKNDAGVGELRVSAWPGQRGKGMGSLALNLGRWSGMVGLDRDPEKLKAIEKSATDVKVGGADAQYVELQGPADSDPQKAMQIAMVYRDNEVWFFVLSGNEKTLAAERKAFDKFLKSVAFEK